MLLQTLFVSGITSASNANRWCSPGRELSLLEGNPTVLSQDLATLTRTLEHLTVSLVVP